MPLKFIFCFFLIFFLIVPAAIAEGGIISALQARSEEDSSAKAEAYYRFSLAYLYQLRNRYEEAITQYQEAMKQDPQSSYLYESLAALYYRRGYIQKAISHCQQAIELDPQSSSPHRLLGSIYYSLFLYSEDNSEYAKRAVEEFEAALKLDKSNNEIYLILGRLYLAQKNYQESIKALYEYLQSNSQSEEARFYLAKNYLEQEDYPAAIENLKQALEIRPNYLRAITTLASIYHLLKDTPNAILTYQKALEALPDDVGLRSSLALEYLEAEEYEKAAEELSTVLSYESDNRFALTYLAFSYHKLGRYEEAEKLYLQMLEKYPDDVDGRLHLAQLYVDLKEYSKALNAYLHLLSLRDKGDIKLGINEAANLQAKMGIIYYRSQDFARAVQSFQQALNLNPKIDRSILPYLVLSYHRNKESDKALEICDQQMLITPSSNTFIILKAEILGDIGQIEEGTRLITEKIQKGENEPILNIALSEIYIRAKKYTQAEEVLNKALSVYPENDNLLFNLGSVFERTERFELAEGTFRKVIAYNPNNHLALNYLGYMLAEIGIKLQESIGYIKRALELDVNNGSYLDSLGWAYFKLNNMELAEKYLTLAVEKEGNSPEIHDHLGDLYYKLGRFKETLQEWEKAISLGIEDANKVREKIEKLKTKLEN